MEQPAVKIIFGAFMNYSIVQIHQLIKRSLKSFRFRKNPPELYQPFGYMLSLGGKRIRPLLTMMSYQLFRNNVEHIIRPALAFELFHNFTLIHDDIMDAAPLRRGKETVHEKFGEHAAILAGDVMMIYAYELLNSVNAKKKTDVIAGFNRAAIEVCEGQQMDLNFEKQPVNIRTYLKMIELKTAVLIAACLKCGAILGGASKSDQEHLYQFGRNMGIAFQLQDDWLDIFGSEKFGKKKGGDILLNKKTFPLLKGIELSKKNNDQRLIDLLTADHPEKISRVIFLLNEYTVKIYCEMEIAKYHSTALKHLELVRVKSDRKKNLLQFATELIIRDY